MRRVRVARGGSAALRQTINFVLMRCC